MWCARSARRSMRGCAGTCPPGGSWASVARRGDLAATSRRHPRDNDRPIAAASRRLAHRGDGAATATPPLDWRLRTVEAVTPAEVRLPGGRVVALDDAELALAQDLVRDLAAYLHGAVPAAVLETDMRRPGQPSMLVASLPLEVPVGSFDVLLRISVWDDASRWAPHHGRLLALDAKITTWPGEVPLDGSSFRAADGWIPRALDTLSAAQGGDGQGLKFFTLE